LQKDGLGRGMDSPVHAPGVHSKDRNVLATRFVRLNAPFEQAVADPRYQRVITRTATELWQSGLNEEGTYEGDKWGGKYLRAPDIYFTILEKASATAFSTTKTGRLSWNQSPNTPWTRVYHLNKPFATMPLPNAH